MSSESCYDFFGREEKMPEISRFLGIVIGMFYKDHEPAHFHARYGSHKAIIAIENLSVLKGRLPPRALGLVMEWATLHREELMADWEAAKAMEPLKPIEPLE
jgi:hypothetical protein